MLTQLLIVMSVTTYSCYCIANCGWQHSGNLASLINLLGAALQCSLISLYGSTSAHKFDNEMLNMMKCLRLVASKTKTQANKIPNAALVFKDKWDLPVSHWRRFLGRLAARFFPFQARAPLETGPPDAAEFPAVSPATRRTYRTVLELNHKCRVLQSDSGGIGC